MDSGKQLLMTMTGEMHQPVRLYYEVYDQAEVLKVFAKLRCVEFDREQKRWIWLYQHEAQPLKFATSYDAIPRQQRPIILGAFLLPHDDVMCLDVRSWERAARAIVFFDQYLKRSVTQVTHAAMVNRLFAYHGGPLPALAEMFAPAKVTERHPEDLLQAAEALRAIPGVRRRLAMALTLLQEKSHEPLPEVEKLPVHYYAEGIGSFETTLKLRQIVAFEHWRGNTQCTLGEVIQKLSAGSHTTRDTQHPNTSPCGPLLRLLHLIQGVFVRFFGGIFPVKPPI